MFPLALHEKTKQKLECCCWHEQWIWIWCHHPHHCICVSIRIQCRTIESGFRMCVWLNLVHVLCFLEWRLTWISIWPCYNIDARNSMQISLIESLNYYLSIVMVVVGVVVTYSVYTLLLAHMDRQNEKIITFEAKKKSTKYRRSVVGVWWHRLLLWNI